MILTKSIKLPSVNYEWYKTKKEDKNCGLAMSELYDLEKIFMAGKGEMTLNMNLALLALCVGEAYDLPKNWGPFQSDHVYNRMIAAIHLAMPDWGTPENIADFMGCRKEWAISNIEQHCKRVCPELRVAVIRYRVIRALLTNDMSGMWEGAYKYLGFLYDEFETYDEIAKVVTL